jgi:gluconate 5-dehydrogenase
MQAFGRIDILINNAGTSVISPAEKMSETDWDKVLDVNLKGVFLVAKHVGTQMIKQNYGKIVNISSIFGTVGNTAFPVVNYHAAKHGVIGITRALAAEWAKYNITVNAIGPGFFESEMTAAAINTPDFQKYVEASCPMKRIGKPGELNGALIYLSSDASTYVTGHTIFVDGGWTSV